MTALDDRKMKVFVQFDEVYAELVLDICRELRRRTNNQIEFFGIAIRRETVRKTLDPVMAEVGIESYDWWNDVEQGILSSAHDPKRLEFYRERIGDHNLRKLVSCCREIGFGLLSGGSYARTKLRAYVEICDENRWHYITGVLDYYYDLLSQKKPVFLFFNEITFPWELAASVIAELLGIPCLVLCYTRSGGSYLIADNPYQFCEGINVLYRKTLQDSSIVEAYINDARQEVGSYRSKPDLPEYSIENQKKIRRQATIFGMLKTLCEDLFKCGAMHLGLFGTRGFLRQENWQDVLFRNIKAFWVTRLALNGRGFEPVSNYKETNYIYYPLHVEPESSTMILSDKLTNLLFFIEQISKSMPAGFKLLVKEHAPMLGRRPKGFYERIRNLPDVHLISPFEDNFKLIKDACVVCVLTGTAGWEAIQLGVPVIIVGEAQYLGIGEGFIRCENLFKLDEYIKEAMEMSPVPVEKVAAFIAATRQLQTDITPRSVFYWHYGLDPDEVIPQSGVEALADQLIQKAGLSVST